MTTKTKNIELSAETLASIAEALGITPVVSHTPMTSESSPFIGQEVVVRTKYAGVHIGTLVAKTGLNVLLSDAVRLWKWTDAFTLSEVATKGCGKESRISAAVSLIELTEAVEIIGTTSAARKTFNPRNG